MLMQVSNKKYMYFEIDETDFDKIKRYKWMLGKRGYICTSIRENNRNKIIYLHRFILELNDPKELVDHKDTNPLNNKRDNLRVTNKRGNMCNSKKMRNTTSIYKGVHYSNNSKSWISQIKNNGEVIHLGSFDNQEDAAKYYDIAATVLFKEFARLNFPENNYSLYTEIQIKDRCRTSRYIGVTYLKSKNKWFASLQFNKKRDRSSLFELESHAAMAYNIMAKKIHGEKAILNDMSGCNINESDIIVKRGQASVYTGVQFNNREKVWFSQIRINGVVKYLGSSKSELEMAKKYDEHVIKNNLNRKLNFPNGELK